jgi:hypothetical protein
LEENGKIELDQKIKYSHEFVPKADKNHVVEPNAAKSELAAYLDSEILPGELLGAILCDGPNFGRRSGYLARITTEGIEVYDNLGVI